MTNQIVGPCKNNWGEQQKGNCFKLKDTKEI